MMRLTMAIWWSLALVWFVTSNAGAEPVSGQAARRLEAKGYGATVVAARKDALREAAARLRAELIQQQIHYWNPDETVIARHLLDDAGRADEDVDIQPLGPQKTWVVQVKIPPGDALLNLNRQALRYETSQKRMGQAMHVLAALTFLLVLAAGTLRADEWTLGRYRRWLWLATAIVTGAVASTWWWLKP